MRVFALLLAAGLLIGATDETSSYGQWQVRTVRHEQDTGIGTVRGGQCVLSSEIGPATSAHLSLSSTDRPSTPGHKVTFGFSARNLPVSDGPLGGTTLRFSFDLGPAGQKVFDNVIAVTKRVGETTVAFGDAPGGMMEAIQHSRAVMISTADGYSEIFTYTSPSAAVDAFRNCEAGIPESRLN